MFSFDVHFFKDDRKISPRKITPSKKLPPGLDFGLGLGAIFLVSFLKESEYQK